MWGHGLCPLSYRSVNCRVQQHKSSIFHTEQTKDAQEKFPYRPTLRHVLDHSAKVVCGPFIFSWQHWSLHSLSNLSVLQLLHSGTSCPALQLLYIYSISDSRSSCIDIDICNFCRAGVFVTRSGLPATWSREKKTKNKNRSAWKYRKIIKSIPIGTSSQWRKRFMKELNCDF